MTKAKKRDAGLVRVLRLLTGENAKANNVTSVRIVVHYQHIEIKA
jgi:hypothetical protein